MRRLTLYTTLLTGQLAFAASTLWLQAQPNMDEKNYLDYWYNIPKTERDDIVAMINSAPLRTNAFDYYKNLINRNADDIPAAIQSVGKLVNETPTITNSLYQQITVARQRIQADHEGIYSLTDSITRAEDILKKDTSYPLPNTMWYAVPQAKQFTAHHVSFSLRVNIDLLLKQIGDVGVFYHKKTVYDKLALALEKLNDKTGKPKPTITQALAELDKMSLNCQQHKGLVDARSTTKTLQEAINAVNGQPANKTYGLLGNLKTTATANGTPLAEHDIYRRLAKGIAHLNELLKNRITGWPSLDPANIGEITQEIIAKTPTTLSPSNPEDTGAGEDEGAGG